MTSLSGRPDSSPQADPGRSYYWLMVDGGEYSPKVFTTQLPGGEKALVVFGFREEGEMYLRLTSGIEEGTWRLYKSGVEELLSVLWGLCAGVRYVVIDPLPQDLSDKLATHQVMGRQEFMEFVMGRRSSGAGVSGLGESGEIEG